MGNGHPIRKCRLGHDLTYNQSNVGPCGKCQRIKETSKYKCLICNEEYCIHCIKPSYHD